jgi:hypothetical protein
VPVLPVARELFSKTKWIASKGAAHIDTQTPLKVPKLLRSRGEEHENVSHSDSEGTQTAHLNHRRPKMSPQDDGRPPNLLLKAAEQAIDDAGNLSDGDRDSSPPKPRSRMFNILRHKSSSRSRTHASISSQGSSDVSNYLLVRQQSNFHTSLPSHPAIDRTLSHIDRPLKSLGNKYKTFYT